jgi:hypothetical protein
VKKEDISSVYRSIDYYGFTLASGPVDHRTFDLIYRHVISYHISPEALPNVKQHGSFFPRALEITSAFEFRTSILAGLYSIGII